MEQSKKEDDKSKYVRFLNKNIVYYYYIVIFLFYSHGFTTILYDMIIFKSKETIFLFCFKSYLNLFLLCVSLLSIHSLYNAFFQNNHHFLTYTGHFIN